MAGIMHFSNFFRFMESCEHDFYRSLGCPIHGDDDEVGWPRVHASCDFHAPLQYDDEATIHLLVLEVKSRAIRYAFRMVRPDETVSAIGYLTVVAVHRVDGRLRATEVPERLNSQITAVTSDRLAELGIPSVPNSA
jgi:YbgC/YbaW family acyl-CoA thioester hydrolase